MEILMMEILKTGLKPKPFLKSLIRQCYALTKLESYKKGSGSTFYIKHCNEVIL